MEHGCPARQRLWADRRSCRNCLTDPPARNDIERTFQDTKHQALPVRPCTTAQHLIAAIPQGFRQLRQQIRCDIL